MIQGQKGQVAFGRQAAAPTSVLNRKRPRNMPYGREDTQKSVCDAG